MKRTVNLAWSGAELTKNEDGDFILTEFVKDETKVYNLTNYLEDQVGADNLAVTIKNTADVPSQE